MPRRNRPGQGGGSNGGLLKGLIASLFTKGGSGALAGAAESEALEGARVNPDYLAEEDINENYYDMTGSDFVGPSQRSPRFIDDRKKLFGFGPRLGSNVANKLNNQYDVANLNNIDRMSQLRTLGNLELGQERARGDLELEQLKRRIPLEVQQVRDAFYAGQGTETSPQLVQSKARQLFTQSELAQRQAAYQKGLLAATSSNNIGTAASESQRMQVEARNKLNASISNEGAEATKQGYIAQQQEPLGRLLSSTRVNLSPGEVSYQQNPAHPFANPLLYGAIPRETPIMTTDITGAKTYAGDKIRSLDLPTGEQPFTPADLLRARAAQAGIAGSGVNGTTPTPIVPPTTSPPSQFPDPADINRREEMTSKARDLYSQESVLKKLLTALNEPVVESTSGVGPYGASYKRRPKTEKEKVPVASKGRELEKKIAELRRELQEYYENEPK